VSSSGNIEKIRTWLGKDNETSGERDKEHKRKGERKWCLEMEEIGGKEGRKGMGRRVRGVGGWYNASHTPAIGGRFLCFRFLFVWDGSHCMILTD